MNLSSFSLQPFPGAEYGPDLTIQGSIGRRGNDLSIDFALLGNPSVIAIPHMEGPPWRRGRLWEETCLEAFLSEKGSERYWEVNLSPTGHWNIYRFASYRKEMQEEPAFRSLSFRVRTEPDALRLSLTLGIETVIPAGRTIEAALCAVVSTPDGRTTHWALVHPGSRPDFHRRDGFVLTIPAEKT